MKSLILSLLFTLSTFIMLSAQVYYLPLSVTDSKAENLYHAATYLTANVRFDLARVEMEKALAIDPDFFMAHVFMYQALAADEEKAAIATKALAIDPTDFTDAEKIMRGQLEIWAKDPKAVPTAAMKALVDTYPSTPEAYEWAALHAAFSEGNMEAARAYAEQLLEFDPTYGPAYNLLGYYHLEKEDMEQAKATFEKYLEMAAAEPNAYDSMGEYYMIAGEYAKSAEYYERASALGMENAQAQADRALAARYQQGQDNIDTYESVWDRIINGGEIDLINSTHFAEDLVMVYSPENVVGIDAFKEHYQHYLTGFSDIEFTIIDVFGSGDQLFKHWRFQGTHTGEFFGIPATGRTVDLQGSTVAVMQDGRIVREHDFMDNLPFFQQLGLLSDPNNSTVVSGVYAAFAKGDIPTVLAALDAEVVWNEAEGNALADGNPYIGPDAVLNGVFVRLGAEHEYFNLKDIQLHTMDNNQVLATLRYNAKRKDTGKVIDAQVAHLWTLRDGKVIAFQQYVDTKQLADAVQP